MLENMKFLEFTNGTSSCTFTMEGQECLYFYEHIYNTSSSSDFFNASNSSSSDPLLIVSPLTDILLISLLISLWSFFFILALKYVYNKKIAMLLGGVDVEIRKDL
jgi:hypothetical protein